MSVEEALLTDDDVARVAEMAVEPSYISEIARKLKEVDTSYVGMNHLQVVQIVSSAAGAIRQNGNLRVDRPSYSEFGGQAESSPKETVSEDNDVTSRWNRYTIVHNTETPFESVRDGYRGAVDPTVTIGEKREMASMVSEMGNVMSQWAEDILFEVAEDTFSDADVIEDSGYRSPEPDLYMEIGAKGYIVEVSTRWENPIGDPYVASKINDVMDAENENNIPVDLIIIAPNYFDSVAQRYRGDDIVALKELPTTDGTPIFVGEIEQDVADFRIQLEEFGREIAVVPEERYRNNMSDVLSQTVG